MNRLGDEDFTTRCTDEFSLTVAGPNTVFSNLSVTPLQRMCKLHIPHWRRGGHVEPRRFSGWAPLNTMDVCNALKEFLTIHVEWGPEFYNRLQWIDVMVTVEDDARVESESTILWSICRRFTWNESDVHLRMPISPMPNAVLLGAYLRHPGLLINYYTSKPLLGYWGKLANAHGMKAIYVCECMVVPCLMIVLKITSIVSC